MRFSRYYLFLLPAMLAIIGLFAITNQAPAPIIHQFGVNNLNGQTLEFSFQYEWEVENAINLTIESVPRGNGENGAAHVSYPIAITDGQNNPINAITLSNAYFFTQAGSYFVRLRAQSASGRTSTAFIPVDILAEPEQTAPPAPPVSNAPVLDSANLQNFALSFGSEDGLLRLNSVINAQWRFQTAERVRLLILLAEDAPLNDAIFSRELPLVPVGSLDFRVAELVPAAGRYFVTLVVDAPGDGQSREARQIDVYPPLPLPNYVQQAWVDAVKPVSVCYLSGGNDTGRAQWQITNNNPAELNAAPSVRVLYDWYLATVVGEQIASASRQTARGTYNQVTLPAYVMVVTTYLEIDAIHRYEVGQTAAITTEASICE